jgi:hypothetical protein
MAQDFFQTANTAFARSINFMGEPFIWNGVTYKGIINAADISADGEAGGFRDGHAVSIYVRKNGFPIPSLGQKMTVRGTELRVISMTADSIAYTLTLNDLAT